MPPAQVQAILSVDEGLLKTCPHYIQEICYNTMGHTIITTAEGTKQCDVDEMDGLKTFSQHRP